MFHLYKLSMYNFRKIFVFVGFFTLFYTVSEKIHLAYTDVLAGIKPMLNKHRENYAPLTK